ncbi:MAG TPA: MFS transporter, partial [Pirellulales bacterium]|nr:MFS transporter [Pirellulales bacterium]
ERTDSAMALGLVGLVQFLPVVALTLNAGQLADRAHRKSIVIVAMCVISGCSFGLTAISHSKADIGLFYLCLFFSGVARAFMQPAKASLLPQIVPRAMFGNAVTWNMGGFQLAAIAGPALGGHLIYYQGNATAVYLFDALATLVFVVLLLFVKTETFEPSQARHGDQRPFVAGMNFVWRNKVILAAMTLDMFAVLLGGAVMLLPIYTEHILHVGSKGLGWLRTAPAAGAFLVSVVLAHRPPFERAGRTLLWVVVGFGAATIVFGLSRSYWLSLTMLFLTGAFDFVSVVIRHTLVQMLTPDAMRGRVSAVNSLFIGASNELGGFESGLVAQLTTPVVSVVSGGIGTLLVVAAVAIGWPQLRRYGRLDGK